MRCYLCRHASYEGIGTWLPGRTDQAELSEAGRAEADRLGAALAPVGIEAIYSSPRRRALDTAAPLAHRLGLPIRPLDRLDDVDYGEWTGSRVDALAGDPRWQRWNTLRAAARAPGGELVAEVAARVVGTLERLRERHPRGRIALVSHCDPIRAGLAHFLGVAADPFDRLAIDPATVSVIELTEGSVRVESVNAPTLFR